MASLFHYTDINALIGILRKEHIVLRATNVLYLNDPSELEEGIKVVAEVFGKECSKDDFRSYYITSFSGSRDNLSMWRAYADNGKGCAIEFDFEKIMNTYLCQQGIFGKCCYEKDELSKEHRKKELDLYNKRVTIQMPPNPKISNKDLGEQMRTNAIAEVCVTWKNVAYKEENEWRGVYYHYIENDKKELKFRVRDGLLIPYIEMEIPKTALKGIILGPSSNIELNQASIIRLLLANGYNHETSVDKSKIPYRG